MYGESWYEWGQLACPNCGQVYPYEQLGELDFFPEHPIFPTLRQPTPNQSCPRCGLAIDGDTKRIACHLATGEPDVGPLPPADEQAVRASWTSLRAEPPAPAHRRWRQPSVSR